jgi:hypothetical protein
MGKATGASLSVDKGTESAVATENTLGDVARNGNDVYEEFSFFQCFGSSEFRKTMLDLRRMGLEESTRWSCCHFITRCILGDSDSDLNSAHLSKAAAVPFSSSSILWHCISFNPHVQPSAPISSNQEYVYLVFGDGEEASLTTCESFSRRQKARSMLLDHESKVPLQPTQAAASIIESPLREDTRRGGGARGVSASPIIAIHASVLFARCRGCLELLLSSCYNVPVVYMKHAETFLAATIGEKAVSDSVVDSVFMMTSGTK